MCVFSLFLFFSFLVSGVFAQTENTGSSFITWRANSFYPSNFEGKPSAVNQSNLTASVTLLQNQKIQDTSNFPISWYLDGDFIQKGTGLSTITFLVGKTLGSVYSLKASINTPSGPVDSLVVVPISNSEVVLDAPLPDYSVKVGDVVTLRSVPYFFNIPSLLDLSFSWFINGVFQDGESSSGITLTIGNFGVSGKTTVKSVVKNTKRQTENQQKEITLFMK